MKTLFTTTLLFFVCLTIAQNKINADNYYSFLIDHNDLKKLKVEKLGGGNLTSVQIEKVLYEEMKRAGFEKLSSNIIVRIDDEKYITSICYSEKSKFGFILEDSFEVPPNKDNLKLVSLAKESTGFDYSEKILDLNGESKWMKIKDLPRNLILIKRDSYWWQSTENEEVNKTLVTKDIALEILRHDIKNILSSFKNN